MSRTKKCDKENPPTTAGDWVGARQVYPGNGPKRKIMNPDKFHIYRASNDHGLFAITVSEYMAKLPPCPGDGKWEQFKVVVETGQQRVGFSEEEAKKDIMKQGYHLCKVDVKVEEIVNVSR